MHIRKLLLLLFVSGCSLASTYSYKLREQSATAVKLFESNKVSKESAVQCITKISVENRKLKDTMLLTKNYVLTSEKEIHNECAFLF